jgi:hypothetical protein
MEVVEGIDAAATFDVHVNRFSLRRPERLPKGVEKWLGSIAR